jgi:hypothetical protein
VGPTFTFTLDGDHVEALARDLVRELDAEMRGSMGEACRVVRDRAKDYHLYTDRTGTLTRSIGLAGVTGRATDGTLSGGVIARAPYASYVEEGTPRFILQPNGYRFLANALEERAAAINQLFVDAVNEAIVRAQARV